MAGEGEEDFLEHFFLAVGLNGSGGVLVVQVVGVGAGSPLGRAGGGSLLGAAVVECLDEEDEGAEELESAAHRRLRGLRFWSN